MLGARGTVTQFRVPFETGRRGEGETTHFANERSFAGVRSFVLPTTTVAAERLRAVSAFVLVGMSMVAHVIHHCFDVGLAADVTGAARCGSALRPVCRSRLVLCAHVPDQYVAG